MCSCSAINSLSPSLSGGLECIAFLGLWNRVIFKTMEGEELITNLGGREVLLLLLLAYECVGSTSELITGYSSKRYAYFFPCAFCWGFGEERVILVIGPPVIL